jgi:hypothetical protein
LLSILDASSGTGYRVHRVIECHLAWQLTSWRLMLKADSWPLKAVA